MNGFLHVRVAVLGLGLVVGCGTVAAQQTAGGGNGFDCVIEPRQVIELGSPDDGVVREILVDRGDVVKEGAPVARLDFDLQALAVEHARLQAERNVEVRSNRAQLQYRRREVDRAQQLHEKSILSTKQLDEAEVERELAEYGLRAAEMDRSMAVMELKVAEARLERRTIRSPVNGIIVELTKSPGELTHDQAPIMTIAQIDPLNVEVFVPIEQYGTITVGAEAEVQPSPPVNGNYTARVEVVDQVLDTASGTFGVRLLLPNPDHKLPAGLKCTVRFPQGKAELPQEKVPDTQTAMTAQPANAEGDGIAASAADEPLPEPDRPGAAWDNKALIYVIQTKLADAGYDPGTADGVLGDRTRAAIRAYQGAHGLEIDGEPSLELFNALRQTASAIQ